GRLGERLEAAGVEVALQAVSAEGGGQRPSGGRRSGGEAAADVGFQTQERAYRGARDVQRVAAVEDAQCGGIRGVAGQLLEVRLGELLDIHRLEVGGAELQDFRAQQEAARIARHVAELLEGQQAAARGRRRDAGAAGD